MGGGGKVSERLGGIPEWEEEMLKWVATISNSVLQKKQKKQTKKDSLRSNQQLSVDSLILAMKHVILILLPCDM